MTHFMTIQSWTLHDARDIGQPDKRDDDTTLEFIEW